MATTDRPTPGAMRAAASMVLHYDSERDGEKRRRTVLKWARHIDRETRACALATALRDLIDHCQPGALQAQGMARPPKQKHIDAARAALRDYGQVIR